jgi:Tol biopolymer transport system component
MNADGSGQTRLTDHIVFEQTMVWSPDSRRIAFTSYRDGNLDLCRQRRRLQPDPPHQQPGLRRLPRLVAIEQRAGLPEKR